jgi:taurine dioxygenase
MKPEKPMQTASTDWHTDRAYEARHIVSDEPAAVNEPFQVTPFDGPLGAGITGLDLAAPLDAESFERIRRAHLEHHVVVFRKQHVTPQQLIGFSRHFGKPMIHVLQQFHLRGHPEILTISNVVEHGKPIGLGNAGKYWHADMSYRERPSLGSLLYAQDVPERGSDILFANMHLAWDTLPEHLRSIVAGRRAVHSYLAKYGDLQKDHSRPNLSESKLTLVKEVAHPIVRTHPETGRKALFVNEAFTKRIEGLPEDESRQVLDEIFAHSVRPEHVYRHVWQDHDLVFWDNRSVVHLITGCEPHLRRTLYRTTVEGDKPY